MVLPEPDRDADTYLLLAAAPRTTAQGRPTLLPESVRPTHARELDAADKAQLQKTKHEKSIYGRG